MWLRIFKCHYFMLSFGVTFDPDTRIMQLFFLPWKEFNLFSCCNYTSSTNNDLRKTSQYCILSNATSKYECTTVWNLGGGGVSQFCKNHQCYILPSLLDCSTFSTRNSIFCCCQISEPITVIAPADKFVQAMNKRYSHQWTIQCFGLNLGGFFIPDWTNEHFPHKSLLALVNTLLLLLFLTIDYYSCE